MEPAASEEVKPLLAADALKNAASKEPVSAPEDSKRKTSDASTAVQASEKLPEPTDISPSHPGGNLSHSIKESRSL